MTKEEVIHNELLIVSVTPQNLERGVLWFTENLAAIKKARITNPWWRDNSLILEKDLVIKPSALLYQLSEMGYERAQAVRGKGLLAARGGIIEIWPVNTEKPWLIELAGNKIETLQEREPISIEVKHQYYRGSTSIEKLAAGSFVVHVDHGIGIFCGVRDGSFIVEYAPPAPGREPDRLFVPLEKEDRLTPYVGFETPRVHRLGGTFWQNTKRRAREDVEKFARELLELYAKREVAERPPYYGDTILLEELRANCPFQETEDQLQAEKEILEDMARGKPMDRILCGDVGFGKTEVALRAALQVISSGRQVIFLAPTTILAAQHEKTFRERISDRLPVTVATLSRLISPREEKKVLAGLRAGTVDCIIGTHRLLSRDVELKNLGLVIIDEEQRFGVKQKEHFKNMRSRTDILSLSATPIPRTLSFALAKLRDISFIKTPPPERLPIQTFVLPYSAKIIREAIRRELSRGGQVYFLHNRIDTLAATEKKLQKLLLSLHYDRNEVIVNPALDPALACKGWVDHGAFTPPFRERTGFKNGVKIGILHGRMKEREIINIMNKFREKEINILLATTIIENGLDISSANTLIVDDAARLGLAEAHQLRGRIGRSAAQSYAYFLYLPQRLIPRPGGAGTPAAKCRLGAEKAAERLAALNIYSELGSGYQIALRDLEIRGAGNILGREQSGAINKVGLNLYCQMLAEAVETAS